MSGLKSIKKPAVKRTQLFINNEWVNAVGGKTFESINPATEDVICSVSFKFQVFVFKKTILTTSCFYEVLPRSDWLT